jgi:hypothetical protein
MSKSNKRKWDEVQKENIVPTTTNIVPIELKEKLKKKKTNI